MRKGKTQREEREREEGGGWRGGGGRETDHEREKKRHSLCMCLGVRQFTLWWWCSFSTFCQLLTEVVGEERGMCVRNREICVTDSNGTTTTRTNCASS